MRTIIKWTVGLLVVGAVLAGASVEATRYFAPPRIEIATSIVRRGEFTVETHTNGTLRAVNSSMMVAPNVGGTLMITTVMPPGTTVHKGDVALAFDREDLQNALDAAISRVDEAQQTIRKANADAAIKQHSDQVDLMKATFAVRRAELDVSKNETVSAIDGQKNILALEAAQKKLAQLKEDISARKSSDAADLAVNEEKLSKAKFDQTQAETRLKQLDVTAPMDGLLSVRTNRMAAGGMWFPDLPDFGIGDQVNGGNPVVDVVDNSALEISAQISETDRGNLKEGQSVVIHLDALPDLPLQGKVKSLGGINGRNWDTSPNKTFEGVFSIESGPKGNDPRLLPGLSGEVVITTEKVPNAVFLPQQAVIEKESKSWVYLVKGGSNFQRLEVTTGRRSESQVEITKGLNGGERVALADPEERSIGAKKKSNPLASSPGGK
jgi:HlyD family secretion protein